MKTRKRTLALTGTKSFFSGKMYKCIYDERKTNYHISFCPKTRNFANVSFRSSSHNRQGIRIRPLNGVRTIRHSILNTESQYREINTEEKKKSTSVKTARDVPMPRNEKEAKAIVRFA